MEARNDAVMEQLHRAIDAYGTGLLVLTSMPKKYGERSVPITFEDRKQLLKKRLLWPFRQETVVGVTSTLDGLQTNLHLTM
jgi:hypothetical protein